MTDFFEAGDEQSILAEKLAHGTAASDTVEGFQVSWDGHFQS